MGTGRRKDRLGVAVGDVVCELGGPELGDGLLHGDTAERTSDLLVRIEHKFVAAKA